MSQHPKGPSSAIKKRGLTVTVKRYHSYDAEQARDNDAKSVESAIRAMKRLSNQEGVIKDVRRKEFHETRGQIRRRKRGEAIRRERKNRLTREW